MRLSDGIRLALAPAIGLVVALTILSGASQAQSVTFMIQNSHPNAVELEFCSLDRDASWPGGGQSYVLDDGAPTAFPLDCEAGETICYGAWVSGDQGTTWGAGPGCADACDTCCATCDGGETRIMSLGE
ncbi:MAG: hypothetical protein RIB84_05865 [Sneathiellaceae bacterium]